MGGCWCWLGRLVLPAVTAVCLVCLVSMQKELGTVSKYNGLLEKKWTTVIRLQKKVQVSHSLCGRLLYTLASPPSDYGT